MKSKQFNSNWDPQQIAALDALFHSFLAQLPRLLSLDSDERQRVNPISDGRLPYTEKCLEAVRMHAGELEMTTEETEQFQQLAFDFEQLAHYRRLVEELALALRDTGMWVGSEYMAQCRIVHDSVRLAVRKGKPGLRSVLEDLDKNNAHHSKGKRPRGKVQARLDVVEEAAEDLADAG